MSQLNTYVILAVTEKLKITYAQILFVQINI